MTREEDEALLRPDLSTRKNRDSRQTFLQSQPDAGTTIREQMAMTGVAGRRRESDTQNSAGLGALPLGAPGLMKPGHAVEFVDIVTCIRRVAMNSFLMTLAGLDKEILLALNSFAPGHKILWDLANHSLFRGFPVFFSLLALWFSGDDQERRGRMLTGLLAVCAATLLSAWSQFHFAVHIRPILDPALHLHDVNEPWPWDRAGSFPSDTATLFFGLAAVILLESRLAGLFCFVWVAVVIAIPRVIFGLHYPSDIIGAVVLGPASVFTCAKIPYPRRLIERALMLFESHMNVVHALLFFLLMEMSNVFVNSQGLAKQLLRLLHF